MNLTVDNISFHAKLGKNLLKQVNKEFEGSSSKLNKFVRLFDDAFTPNIDKETVVDINKNHNFVFCNNNFPEIKYQHSSKMRETDSVAMALINECYKLFGNGENSLFKITISKYLKNGKNLSELEKLAEKIINPKSRDSFLEKIEIAKRLKKEYPNTKFSQEEFDYMQNKIIQEEAETPGTYMYNLIHNFNKSSLTFY